MWINDIHAFSRNAINSIAFFLSEGNWVSYELKPKNVKQRLFTCEQRLRRQKRKAFLHCIVTDNEKRINYDSPMREKLWGRPGHALKNQPKPSRKFVIDYSWRVWAEHCRKNGQHTSRHDKMILQHANA